MTDFRKLSTLLYEKRASARVVQFEDHGEEYLESECHRNVGAFVRDHPDHKAVRGWMVFDFEATSKGLAPLVRFTAHSVVEDPSGRRFDITPSRASKRYPFLDHHLSDENFRELIEENGLIHLDHETL